MLGEVELSELEDSLNNAFGFSDIVVEASLRSMYSDII